MISEVESDANQTARLAYILMHPSMTREEYDGRVQSRQERGDDLEMRIEDCENCLENYNFDPETDCHEAVARACGVLKGMKQVIDEVASDPSIILT